MNAMKKETAKEDVVGRREETGRLGRRLNNWRTGRLGTGKQLENRKSRNWKTTGKQEDQDED